MPIKTRRSLEPAELLLVGRLDLKPGNRFNSPWIEIVIWCPVCKCDHGHGWPPQLTRTDAVTHRISHCHDQRGEPPILGNYFIGLHPSHADHNKQVLRKYPTILANWESR